MLEYAKRVTVNIQGGSDGILSPSVRLCHQLVDILSFEHLELVDLEKMREAKEGDEPLVDERKCVNELQTPEQTAISVWIKHTASSDVEVLALHLDPRYKTLDLTVYGSGDIPTESDGQGVSAIKRRWRWWGCAR